MKLRRLVVMWTVALLTIAGCGGANESSGDDGDAAGGAAGGTSPRAYPVEEAIGADVDGPILVTGALIHADGAWRLCSAIAESHPPQCAGESVTVEGVDPSWFTLQEASGVQWSEDATVFGELSDMTLSATGPASAA